MNKRRWKESAAVVVATASLSAMTGCQTEHRIRVDPIEVKPVTLNVNIRIEKKLNDFFDYEETASTQGGAKTEGAR